MGEVNRNDASLADGNSGQEGVVKGSGGSDLGDSSSDTGPEGEIVRSKGGSGRRRVSGGDVIGVAGLNVAVNVVHVVVNGDPELSSSGDFRNANSENSDDESSVFGNNGVGIELKKSVFSKGVEGGFAVDLDFEHVV